jgi:hypothetical protein
MKKISYILLGSVLLLSGGCISQFIPQTTEDNQLLVVEGLVTDQPGAYTIKLSRPFHLGTGNAPRPVTECAVSISDDTGQTYNFIESAKGTYTSDPTKFQGIMGRFYTLHIKTNAASSSLNYESLPMELKPVPPIDSIYYEKVSFQEATETSAGQEGCQVFLNTHDPNNECKFYRWEYTETWEFRLPYTVPKNTCWISNSSDIINIKNTSVLDENRVNRYPLNLISNLTDRLRINYSILVNQYSLNEDEYLYWEKLQNTAQQVGGLYDMIPSGIPSNIYCLEDPNQQVLGYFSVSGCSSKRMFIRDRFAGVLTPYTDAVCIADTVYGSSPIRDLNTFVWIIVNQPLPPPGLRVLTRVKGCYDCTLRGTDVRPAFWEGE